MRPNLTPEEYINGILLQDRNILSKAITLIESNREEDEKLAVSILEACIKQNKSSKRIAVTGIPSAGKSTFINAWGKDLLENGKTVAILAIDPSSSISKGSILADKTRMDDLAGHENCFIRPTASSNNLGGVAKTTRETMLLCEAFGFDYILIETVGVGQSETIVKNMTDLFLLLLLPNTGDDLQGIKRGIMEMADIILINKSEDDNIMASKRAATQIKQVLHLFSTSEKDWTTPVLNVSALHKKGLSDLQQQVDSYFLKMKTTGFIGFNRKQQDNYWFEETIQQALLQTFSRDKNIQTVKKELLKKLENKEITPINAAKLLVQKFLKYK